ncbi:MAG: lipoprotein-releasing ABC transporter permease subunit [Burkholderiaceae bacterium]|jgi:lipoprotein-releasing system permease protein
MRFELHVGLRYTRAGRSTRFVNFISFMATAGIGLGVAALIIVLSVMNGFQKEVRDRMLGVLSHVEVLALAADADELDAAKSLLAGQPGVLATAPFVVGQAMTVRGDQMKGLMIRGIDPSQEVGVTPALAALDAGSLTALSERRFGVVIGRELAITMSLSVGDGLSLVTADTAAGPAGILPRMKTFEVVGIFASGHHDYDSALVFIHQQDALAFFRGQALVGLRARLADMQSAPAVSSAVGVQLPSGLVARDWTQENRNWFAAVQLEKRMMFIILTLIIAVAAFNLVSMLVMTVMDKRGDIAILRTLGAQRTSILLIFMVQGASLGVLGVLLGLAMGVTGALNIGAWVASLETWFGFQVLPKGIYLINQLPSDLRLQDVVQVGLVSLILSLLATVYPSWRAANTDPAEALRHD